VSSILKFPDFSLTLSVFPDRRNPANNMRLVLSVRHTLVNTDRHETCDHMPK